MERNMFWIFLGVGVAFGLAMELMKGSAPDENRIRQMAGAQYELADDRIDDIATARAGRISGAVRQIAPPQTITAQVAGLDPNIGETTAKIAPAPTNAADAKKAAAKKDDKKKKKKDDKKKKKAKQKIGGANQPANSETSDEDEESDTSNADKTLSAAPTSLPAPMFATPAKEPGDIPQTQRDWELLVLREPDFKAVEKLVKFYQSEMVSAEIFYNVVRQMIEDSRPKMRQLGVIALGVTPSPRSFAELAFVLESETGVTPLKSQAQRYMKTYTEIQHVRILGSVMQYRDLPTVVLEAMRLLRVAADIHLKNRRTPAEQAEIDQPPDNGTIPDPHAGQQSGQQSTGSSSAKRKKLDTAIYFRPFVTLLQHLQERYTEPELKKAASETLSYLQALLPVVPTPTGSSTPGSSHDQTQGIPLAGN